MFLSGLRASVALEEGMCRAVESGEPIQRAESVGQHRQAEKLDQLHLQNKDCLQESRDWR